jgi:hypothetical protein
MSNIVIYNPGAVVANQVTSYLTSVNTPDYYSEPNKVINPDLSAVLDQPMKWWKVSGGNVVLMSQIEKDTVDESLLPAAKIERKNYLQNASQTLLDGREYTSEKRHNFQAMYADGNRMRPKRASYLQPLIDWFGLVDLEVKNKQDAVDAATTLDAVAAIELDTATLIAADPNKTLKGALEQSDTLSLATFVNANAEVTDPDTGKKGPFYLMQQLEMRKDLYNDTENPLYKVGHTPILGVTGILTDHANRVLNLETIHGKYGWHSMTIIGATYKRPLDLLIYYGYPNSFNSGTNGWVNEKVAQDMAKYSLIVLGDTVEDPAHPDYANTQVIIPRIKALNPNALIFGYVACAQTLSNFQTKVGQWNTLQVHGIFMDEAGYDYGKTRAEFNTMVDYIHGRTYANLCFANAWNTDNILGTANDASFPNSTYNPSLVQSNLNYNDWILLESFPVNTAAYSGNGGYESKSDWYVRGQKIIDLRATYLVNFVGSCVINNGNASGAALFNFGFISSMMYNLESFGSSDTNYASSSAAVTWWTRPDVSNIGKNWSLYPVVQNDVGDADVYHRYVENAKMSLDFSTGAQLSSITKR